MRAAQPRHGRGNCERQHHTCVAALGCAARKAGGTQRKSAGTIRVDDVTEYPGSYRVTAAQARAAGYPDAKTAQKELDRRPARHTYVIAVSYLAPDERPELASDDRLTDADVSAISARLDRWECGHRAVDAAVPDDDRRQRGGPGAGPRGARRARVPRFKRRVRQLKGLGLTISLDVGYRLSSRGRAYLRLTS